MTTHLPGLFCLLLAYVLSQFYRAFLAVLAPALDRDLGLGADTLSLASGLWFLAFAAMQIPVGAALDRIGPRRTAAALFLVGASGAGAFAAAQTAWHVHGAMMLIGVGCSPVLMASYFIFARSFRPALFATLAGVTLGIGTLGNLASSLPLTLVLAELGWRTTMAGLAAITAAVALGIAVLVRDPPQAKGPGGSVLTLLRMPAIWPILAIMTVNYVPAAAIRGFWIAPYLTDSFAIADRQVGTITLIMALAMIAGNFLYGPADRVFSSRKSIVLTGNLAGVAALCALIAFGGTGPSMAAALFALVGVTGATFVVIIAHARAFFPDHLTGRGVTLLNLFGIGGAGSFQALSGRVFTWAEPWGTAAAYQVLFGFFAGALALGCLAYAFSRDARADG
ncbi:MAG: MFS transporter [Pseudomonadota bacterium]